MHYLYPQNEEALGSLSFDHNSECGPSINKFSFRILIRLAVFLVRVTNHASAILQPYVEFRRTDHLLEVPMKIEPKRSFFSRRWSALGPLFGGPSRNWPLGGPVTVFSTYFLIVCGPAHVVHHFGQKYQRIELFTSADGPTNFFIFHGGVIDVNSGKSGTHLGVILGLKQNIILNPTNFFRRSNRKEPPWFKVLRLRFKIK